MTPNPEWGSLPFDEAIAFFRAKLSVPTAHWDELWGAANDRAFTVAGATAEALRADLLAAVDSAVAKGTTLEQFRRAFRDLVQRHGWTGWTGEGDAAGVAWRTEVIYSTNCATAYAAGRWTQLTHPDVTSRMPYWMYRHSDSVAHPRPLHVSWDGLVLPWNHPWWKTHFTPNGWGCMCYVVALSEKDLRALGKKEPDQPPNDGTYEWINKRTGEVHQVPEGIDPGWDYAPGASGPFGGGR